MYKRVGDAGATRTTVIPNSKGERLTILSAECKTRSIRKNYKRGAEHILSEKSVVPRGLPKEGGGRRPSKETNGDSRVGKEHQG